MPLSLSFGVRCLFVFFSYSFSQRRILRAVICFSLRGRFGTIKSNRKAVGSKLTSLRVCGLCSLLLKSLSFFTINPHSLFRLLFSPSLLALSVYLLFSISVNSFILSSFLPISLSLFLFFSSFFSSLSRTATLTLL